VLDIDQIKQEMSDAKKHHLDTLEQLGNIESPHLDGQVKSLQYSIRHAILRPIERAEYIIEMIEQIGIDQLPTFLLHDWMEELTNIRNLSGGYDHEGDHS
tara:strand:- start:139 stop:438 length:300 start_codon:yes stop_codon:yes gene_type:complete